MDARPLPSPSPALQQPRTFPRLPDNVRNELAAQWEEAQAAMVDSLNRAWAEYISQYRDALGGNGGQLPNPADFLLPPLVHYGAGLYDAFARVWLDLDPKPGTDKYLSWLQAPLQESVAKLVTNWMRACTQVLAIEAEAREVVVALWRVDQGRRLHRELAKAMSRRELHWRPIGIRTLAPASSVVLNGGEASAVVSVDGELRDELEADAKHRAYVRLLRELAEKREAGESMDTFWDRWCKKHHAFGRTTATNYRKRRTSPSAVLVEAAILADANELGLRIPSELDADFRGFCADSSADERG